MKKIVAILLSAALLFSVTGCAGKPAVSSGVVSAEGTLISRTEEAPLVTGEEYPDTNDINAIEPEAQPSSAKEATEPEKATNIHNETKDALTAEKTSKPAVDAEPTATVKEPEATQLAASTAVNEVRAVWISYLDLMPIVQGKSKSEFRSNIRNAFDNCAEMGLNTLIVQVRPFADALYESAYFPYSYIVNGSNLEGYDPGFDPLEIMVTEAHSRGLKIEAWLNPYRVRNPNAKIGLSGDSIAAQWQNDYSDYVIEYKTGLYFNPARKDVQDLIVNGVIEIVKNYAVDGIHFDDYFYPSPDNNFDSIAYDEYTSGGGKKSLGDWRRNNVNTLVKRLYKEIKAIRSSCKFGISPQGNHGNNYSQQYIDVAKWGSTPGYVDYICPQIYWGYENKAAPYSEMLSSWEDMITSPKVQLYVGLASYKIGGNEKDFTNSTDIMERQVSDAREMKHYKGFALYRYDSLFNPPSKLKKQIATEKNNLMSIFS